jgi:hypothetical protein
MILLTGAQKCNLAGTWPVMTSADTMESGALSLRRLGDTRLSVSLG